MNDTCFQMEKLSVGYHGNTLIHDICAEIKKGEIVTLIGPNGSGKSTILKSITRQLRPISGAVYLEGGDLKELPLKQMAQKMAVVLTERLKPELMTCRDVVAAGRYPYTGRMGILSAEDERKVDEAMEAVHVSELGENSFGAVSDGQKQRILLARAICQEPEVLILDEPTSFLDIRHKLELLSILRTMAKERNLTVIMSLHEIDLAQKISDRIMCVKGDRISCYGPPEEIFKEEIIRDLYELEEGAYDPCFGSIELPKPTGEPRVLVLSSCGNGIPVYRKLQKQNIPFIAGILYTNDTDYQLAKVLAAEIIEEKPFFEISEETFRQAVRALQRCDTVIDAGVVTGPCCRRAEELLRMAEEQNKLRKQGDSLWQK